jgi:hypothetical protein
MIRLRARKGIMNTLRRGSATAGMLLAAVFTFAPASLLAADAVTWQQKEDFLTKAKIVQTKDQERALPELRASPERWNSQARCERADH